MIEGDALQRNTPPIVTRRLRLRDFREGDFEQVHRYASDPRVTENLCWGPNTPEQTKAFLKTARLEAGAKPRTTYNLGIEERETGEIVGGLAMRPHGGMPATLELSYSLRADRWGMGFGSEAVAGAVAFGFEKLGLERLVAEVFLENVASSRILEKLNFLPGDPFERHVGCRGETHQSRLFTLDRTTWRQD